jgi:hypothetical protein
VWLSQSALSARFVDVVILVLVNHHGLCRTSPCPQ